MITNEGFDCLLVDGPNFWNLLKACDGIPHLFTDFIPQVEEKLGEFFQRPVHFEEKIWVSPSLNPRRPNTQRLKRLFCQLQRFGWQIRLAFPNSLGKSDDQLLQWLLWEKAETLPSGSILALGSGDGDFVETLKRIKLERGDLFVVVLTGNLPPYFVANLRLREVADFFLDIFTLPCLRRVLTAGFLGWK